MTIDRFVFMSVLSLVIFHDNASAAEVCPAKFTDFVARFSTDLPFQKKHTAQELTVSHVIDDDPEPRTVVRKVKNSKLKFPLMESTQAQRRKGLITSFQRSKGGDQIVLVHKPDTDWQIRFTFRKDACWLLIRRDDESL